LKLTTVLKQCTIAIFILSWSFSTAQINKVPNLKIYDYETLHFGFILAGNQMLFRLQPKENLQELYFKGKQLPEFDLGYSNVDSAMIFGIEPRPSVGFTVGIVGDLRLGEYFNLRFIPSLAFGSRDLNYAAQLYRSQDTIPVNLNQRINSTFVEFPFLLKYKSERVHNMRAYVTGGAKFSFDLASQANKKEDDNYEPKLLRTDTYGVVGVGIDYYMNWFKFGVELSMSYGLKDILLREGNMYTESIESLRSKLFMITFTFE
jgi:hypothetical protein